MVPEQRFPIGPPTIRSMLQQRDGARIELLCRLGRASSQFKRPPNEYASDRAAGGSHLNACSYRFRYSAMRESTMKGDLEFRIHGMDCADEVAILRRALNPLVQSADRLAFEILRGKMTVRGGSPPATLWMAIAADMGVSLVVIANALRLLRLSDR